MRTAEAQRAWVDGGQGQAAGRCPSPPRHPIPSHPIPSHHKPPQPNPRHPATSREEKHAKETPSPRKDTKSHLYTLAIKADNSYEMFVDLESKAKGSLLEDMEPPVNPAKVRRGW